VAEIDESAHEPTVIGAFRRRRFVAAAECPISAGQPPAQIRSPHHRQAMNDDAPDRNSFRPSDMAAWWLDLKIAAAFLTRLPIRAEKAADSASLSRAARCFPLVGLAIGLLGGVVYAVAIEMALPPLLASMLAVAAAVAVTGALHEDGLADTVDGFGGGGDRDSKLRIMRDSRIGTYGVAAVVLALGARVVALASFEGNEDAVAALILCHAASRAFVVAVMQRAPLARPDGLAAAAGRPTQATMLWALGLGGLVALAFAGLDGAAAAIAGAAAAWAIAGLARRQIGGVTGDVLGAVQQGSEVAMLLALVALD
jgi:adenosylcobinamide-GDP ribazoletransferase